MNERGEYFPEIDPEKGEDFEFDKNFYRVIWSFKIGGGVEIHEIYLLDDDCKIVDEVTEIFKAVKNIEKNMSYYDLFKKKFELWK